ncbi:MAG: hypothetical protein M0R21_07770 [Lentimicrobiaceae bacterium]|nr:hypothetical protein [Lentimicrobiaceae bacterium]
MRKTKQIDFFIVMNINVFPTLLRGFSGFAIDSFLPMTDNGCGMTSKGLRATFLSADTEV